MLAETPPAEPHPDALAAEERPDLRQRGAELCAFTLTAAVVLLYALRGDGSFDLVTRQGDGLVIWWVIAIGTAVGLLPRRVPSRVLVLTAVALLLFAIWGAISLGWTESAERTTNEVARSLDYLGLIILFAFCLGRTDWRAAALGWAFAAVVVCGLAMASRLDPGPFPANNAGTVFALSRLSYPFGYWNAVGAWASTTATLTLGWSAHDRRRVIRALALAAVPLAAGTAYLTYSRAALIALGVGAAAVLALSRNRWTALIHLLIAGAGSAAVVEMIRGHTDIARGTGTAGAVTIVLVLVAAAALGAVGALATARLGTHRWRLPRSAGRSLAAAVAVVLVLAAAVAGPHVVTKAWNEFRHPQVVTTANPTARLTSLSGTRFQLWKVALHAFDAKPLTGTGAGTFEFWWNRHATQSEFVQNAHSIWLENMAELGLPGLLLIVIFSAAMFAAALVALRRSRRGSSAAACVAATAAFIVFMVQASVDWMWQSTAVTVLALTGVAIVTSRASRPRAQSRRATLLAARVVLAVAAIAAGAVQVPGLLSQEEIHASQTAARSGQGGQALAWANDAVSAEPWAASPYLQRALVLEGLGRLRSATADIRRATDREPTNFELWVIRSRVDTERGHLFQAVRDYGRAYQLRPLAIVLQKP
jgi:O-Antigen ligase